MPLPWQLIDRGKGVAKRLSRLGCGMRGVRLTVGVVAMLSIAGLCSAGSITREVWTEIGGTYVSDLTRSLAYAGAPLIKEELPAFEIPANCADNYGTRLRGRLKPPASGMYRFAVSGDDACELWLGLGEDPSTKRRICRVTTPTLPRQWTRYRAQMSDWIQLEAGKLYYIEALHKESYNADHMAVAWVGPGVALDVIAGAHLVSLASPGPLKPVADAGPAEALAGETPDQLPSDAPGNETPPPVAPPADEQPPVVEPPVVEPPVVEPPAIEQLPVNEPPYVEAGDDQQIGTSTGRACLAGTVLDDGLPNPPAIVESKWYVASDVPLGAVAFEDPLSPTTAVTFPRPGEYVLYLFVTDAELSASDKVTIRVVDDVPPSAPVNVRAAYDPARGVAIAWDASHDEEGIAAYTVFRDGVEIAATEQLSALDRGFAQGLSYTYTVRAADATGNMSPLSDEATVMAGIPRIDAIEVTPLCREVEAGGAVSFRASASDQYGRSIFTAPAWSVDGGGAIDADGAFTATVPGGPYAVTAMDEGVVGSASVTVLRDATPPSVPADLSARVVSEDIVELAWMPARDAIGVAGYIVYRDGVAIAEVTSTRWSDSGLNAGATYIYELAAYDAERNTSARTLEVVASTPGPNTPPSVNVTSPPAGGYVVANVPCTMVAEAADADDAVDRVEFYLDGVLIGLGERCGVHYSFVWTSGTQGTHRLTARAYDSRGGASVSEVRAFTVGVARSCTVEVTGGTIAGEGRATGTFDVGQTVTIRANEPGSMSRFSHWTVPQGSTTVMFDDGDALETSFVAVGSRVYVFACYEDVSGNVIERVSVANRGGDANGASSFASVSADGRYVAFMSDATDLDPVLAPRGGVFVFDRDRHELEVVSVCRWKDSPEPCWGVVAREAPSISADGRYVAFAAVSTNLVPEAMCREPYEIYIYDRITKQMELVMPDGNPLFGVCRVSLSADGKRVACIGTNPRVWPRGCGMVYDRNEDRLITIGTGERDEPADGNVYEIALAASGQHVVFVSDATNMLSDAVGEALPTQDAQGIVSIEAETATRVVDGTTHRWNTGWNYLASAGAGMVAQPDRGSSVLASAIQSSPRLDYHLRFTRAGTQRLWLRAFSYSGASSAYVAIDEGDPQLFTMNQYMPPRYIWGYREIAVPSAGEHVLRVWMCQDGFQLDKIVVSADLAYTPDAEGPPASETVRLLNGRRQVYVTDLASEDTYLVSHAADFAEGDGDSRSPSISQDGLRVAFASDAGNFTSGFRASSGSVVPLSNGPARVFLYECGGVRQISTGMLTNEAPAISADGQSVAYVRGAIRPFDLSTASHPIMVDHEVVLHELDEDAERIVSRTRDGSSIDAGANQSCVSGHPALSQDGRFVAFESNIANLVPADGNGCVDMFVADTQRDVYTLTVDGGTGAGRYRSGTEVRITAHDSFDAKRFSRWSVVASPVSLTDASSRSTTFVMPACNVTVRAQFGMTYVSSSIERVSRNAGGASADDWCFTGSISPDGRHVAVATAAGNFDDTYQGGRSQIYYRALGSMDIRMISIGPDGAPGDADSYSPSMSSDGQYVAFVSYAESLIPEDLWRDPDYAHGNIHLWDASTNELTLVSRGVGAGNNSAYEPAMSADGRYIAFASAATNLVLLDANGARDSIFIYDRVADALAVLAIGLEQYQLESDACSPHLSGDGRLIAFASADARLSPDDDDAVCDVYVYDRECPERGAELITRGLDGPADGGSDVSGISEDGRYVVFYSNASNLVQDDDNGVSDAFVHDRVTGRTVLASRALDGTSGQGCSWTTGISADGRYVLFDSYAGDLVPGDGARYRKVFVYDTRRERVTMVSCSDAGAYCNGDSYGSSLASDGRHVLFNSTATNLVAEPALCRAQTYVAPIMPPEDDAGLDELVWPFPNESNESMAALERYGISLTPSAPQVPRAGPASMRRADMHGVPLPDASPTGEGESDRKPSTAEIDMYSLAPSYNVTDVAVPLEGGELLLEFRRTASLSSRLEPGWFRSLCRTYATDVPYPFPSETLLGPCWDTNLGSRIVVTNEAACGDEGWGAFSAVIATVSDETGATYRYKLEDLVENPNAEERDVWVPDVRHSFDNESMKHRLVTRDGNRLVLKKEHGTVLTYALVGSYGRPGSPGSLWYYRLEGVVDRNGNALFYTYGDEDREWVAAHDDVEAGAFLPVAIEAGHLSASGAADRRDEVHAGRRIRFEYTDFGPLTYHDFGLSPRVPHDALVEWGWRLSAVIDPLGRRTTYAYRGRMLHRVTLPRPSIPIPGPLRPPRGRPSSTTPTPCSRSRTRSIRRFVPSRIRAATGPSSGITRWSTSRSSRSTARRDMRTRCSRRCVWRRSRRPTASPASASRAAPRRPRTAARRRTSSTPPARRRSMTSGPRLLSGTTRPMTSAYADCGPRSS